MTLISLITQQNYKIKEVIFILYRQQKSLASVIVLLKKYSIVLEMSLKQKDKDKLEISRFKLMLFQFRYKNQRSKIQLSFLRSQVNSNYHKERFQLKGDNDIILYSLFINQQISPSNNKKTPLQHISHRFAVIESIFRFSDGFLIQFINYLLW